MYVRLWRNHVVYSFYAVSVTQNFQAYGSWTTHVQFERGRTRIDRKAGDYGLELSREKGAVL
jgi:hypothetical protein